MMQDPFGAVRSARALAVGAGLAALLLVAPLVRGTTVQPPEFEQLVGGADYVVHAVVTAVNVEQAPEARGRIFTHVEFAVREPVAGAVPARVVLRFRGGRIGREALVIQGMPEFRVGDEEILFVKANGRSVCPLVGMMHGRYRVAVEPATGRRYVQRDDGLPLRSTGDVALPHGQIALDDTSRAAAVRMALSPEEFMQRIRVKAAERNRAR